MLVPASVRVPVPFLTSVPEPAPPVKEIAPENKVEASFPPEVRVRFPVPLMFPWPWIEPTAVLRSPMLKSAALATVTAVEEESFPVPAFANRRVPEVMLVAPV